MTTRSLLSHVLALTLAAIASLVFIDEATATPVEGTYTFTQTDPNSGLDEYVHTHRFSSGRIKQGEPLEFMGRIDHTNRGWCFSSDVYDIQQTELNFRTAYSPRGYPHDVVGAQVRIYVTFRNRAWVSRENDPRCVQHHELTGTITGSETRQFEPGCYVLETYWEYGPSPKPRGTDQRESGTLPHFCVDAGSQTPQPPSPPASPLPPGTPPPAPPPGSPPPSPVPPTAAGMNDFGFSCGTTRYGWHHLTKQPTFVKRGEYACVVLLSNRLSRALIDLAVKQRWDIATAYVSTHRDATVLDGARFAAKFASVPVLQRVFPMAATTLGRLNAIYSAPQLFTYGVIKPLFGAFVLRQYVVGGACAQFLVDVDVVGGRKQLRADWSIVYNPRTGGNSFASVWQSTRGKVVRRHAGLRCGLNGSVLAGRADSIFARPVTQLFAG